MPITASLGALSYSRNLDAPGSWYSQITSNENLIDIEVHNNRLYLMLVEQGNRPQYFSILSVLLPNNPLTIWQTNIFTKSFPEVSAAVFNTVGNDNLVVANIPAVNFPINSPIRFTGSVFGGVSAGVTYYVRAYGPFPSQFSISTTPGGGVVNLSQSSGAMTVSRFFGTEDPPGFIRNSRRLRYNVHNNTLHTLNGMRAFVDAYREEVGFPAYICSFNETDGTLITNYFDLSTETTAAVSNLTKVPLDITFIDSNNYVTINSYNTFPPGGQPRSRQSLQRQENDTTQIFQTVVGPNNKPRGTISSPGYVDIDSNGDIISVNNVPVTSVGPPTISTNNVLITKSNPTTGSVIWQRLFEFQNVAPPQTLPFPQSFRDAVLDSNDNLYMVFLESRVLSPTNNLGGFIVKLDNDNNVIWERHIDNMNLTGIDVDTAGNLYVVGSKSNGPPPTPRSSYIAKFDSGGNVVWSNELEATGPISNTRTTRIKVNDDHIIVGGSIAITAIGVFGFIARLPADGSIPGTGSYAIDIPSTPYTLEYQSTASNVFTYPSFLTSTTIISGDPVVTTPLETAGITDSDKSTTKIVGLE